MNRIEKIVYNSIKNNPQIKDFVRDLYQVLLYCVPTVKIQTEYNIYTHEGYFFGFHDKIPFSADNKYLLAHKIDNKQSKQSLQKKDSYISVGYFYGDKYSKFREIAKTNAWNYQQGSMLQWVGQSNNLIFNYYDEKEEKHIAIVLDLEGGIVQELPMAIGAVSNNGEYAISYSFERLRNGMPGYGYENGKDTDDNNNIPNQGLELINIRDGAIKSLFKIRDLIDFSYDKSMKNSFHFFTHCIFAPSGKRFLFFHRWQNSSSRLKTRMFTANIDGTGLHLFPTNGMVSHVCWVNDDQILGYAETGRGNHYHLFTDKTDKYELIGEDFFTCDGHPQLSPDGKKFITDTYPDRRRIQSLILYDILKNEGKIIGKFRSPLKYKNQFRCDLHPRWDRSGKWVCFDSTYLGKRSLSIMNLSEKN